MPHPIDPRFRDRLIALMTAADISAKALAAKASVSRSYLSEIINGVKMPSEEIAQALDRALGAGGRLANLVGIAALTGDRDELAHAAAMPHRVGDATLDALSRVLSAQRYLEDSVGAAAVIGPVAAQLEVIVSMVRSARGLRRAPVLSVAGPWAQYAGWLHMSLGRWDDSRTWNSRALEWAVENDDRELAATVLSYQAHLAELTLDWGATAGLSRAAMRDESVYPGQRAYDAYQVARGHAVIGDIAEAQRMLAVGDGIAAQVDGWTGEIPSWQYYRDEWLWELERGLVWRYIARWKPAVAATAEKHLRAGLDGIPPEWQGSDWAAEYMVHLAGVYIAADAPRTARDVLERARRVAEATGSTRVLRMVAARERQLRHL